MGQTRNGRGARAIQSCTPTVANQLFCPTLKRERSKLQPACERVEGGNFTFSTHPQTGNSLSISAIAYFQQSRMEPQLSLKEQIGCILLCNEKISGQTSCAVQSTRDLRFGLRARREAAEY